METKSTLLFLILIQYNFLFSQSDTLNRLDANGEKTGWWLIYLDDNLKQLKSSEGATHCRFTLYTGKFDHFNMGTIGTKKSPVIFPTSDTINYHGLKLLNGDYQANFESGKPRFILSAQNGILTEYKEFYENGQLKTNAIYSKECGAPIRCCVKTYDKAGKILMEGVNRVPGD